MIQILYLGWVLTGVAALGLLAPIVARAIRSRDWPPYALFALGMLLTTVGSAIMTRGWWLVWRVGFDAKWPVGWMTDHPIVVVGALLALIGFHIKIAALVGARQWAMTAAVLATVWALGYALMLGVRPGL